MYGAAPGARYVDGNGPFAPLEPSLSAPDLMALWVNAGGDPAVADQAAAIALAESAGVPNAVNPVDNNGSQTSWGLFQLSNGTHTAPGVNWANPAQNAAGAVAKYNAAGKTFAQDWGTYGGSAFQRYLAQIDSQNYATTDPYNQNSELGDGGSSMDNGTATPPPAGGNAGGVWQWLFGAPNPLQPAVNSISNVAKNFGPFVIALALIAIGAMLLAMSWGESLVETLERTAAPAAKAVAENPEILA